jgi:hypothetical protein
MMKNNKIKNYLFISKSYGILQYYLSWILFGIISFALFKFGHFVLGVIFVSLLLWKFSKIPMKVYFYEEKFIATYFFKDLNGAYSEVNKIAFQYTGPFTHPALVIYWKNMKIGFDWGADKAYLIELLKFFSSRQITISDPDDLLKNYIKKSKL